MPTDRFETFIEALYSRYVLPNLPPPPPVLLDFTDFILFGEGDAIEFDFTGYIGEGSAQITIDGVGPITVSFTEGYVDRWLVEQQGQLFTLFFLEFLGIDSEGDALFATEYDLYFMISETGDVAKPSRTSYSVQIGSEGEPNAGSVIWIWVDEFPYELIWREFYAASNPTPFSAGFSGTFLESVDGEATGEGDPIPITLQSFSFTFEQEITPR